MQRDVQRREIGPAPPTRLLILLYTIGLAPALLGCGGGSGGQSGPLSGDAGVSSDATSPTPTIAGYYKVVAQTANEESCDPEDPRTTDEAIDDRYLHLAEGTVVPCADLGRCDGEPSRIWVFDESGPDRWQGTTYSYEQCGCLGTCGVDLVLNRYTAELTADGVELIRETKLGWVEGNFDCDAEGLPIPFDHPQLTECRRKTLVGEPVFWPASEPDPEHHAYVTAGTEVELSWASAVTPDGSPVRYDVLLGETEATMEPLCSDLERPGCSFDIGAHGEYSWQVLANSPTLGTAASQVWRIGVGVCSGAGTRCDGKLLLQCQFGDWVEVTECYSQCTCRQQGETEVCSCA